MKTNKELRTVAIVILIAVLFLLGITLLIQGCINDPGFPSTEIPVIGRGLYTFNFRLADSCVLGEYKLRFGYQLVNEGQWYDSPERACNCIFPIKLDTGFYSIRVYGMGYKDTITYNQLGYIREGVNDWDTTYIFGCR